MHVSWEAVTAVAALLSSVAVLAAVIVAIGQVRVGAAQVDHLRRATQLEGTMKIFDKLASEEQLRARRFITHELAERLTDPTFRAELAVMTRAEDRHLELKALRLMEMIGTYVKHGLLDAEIIFDYWSPAVEVVWERLDSLGVIAAHRGATTPAMWENFEYLFRRCEEWLVANGQPSMLAGGAASPAAAARNEVVADSPQS
ncbi:MAG: hypothetical protein JWO66_2749 [Candidatus Eremiobacteraeota bacterium]|nr:hypothetical protein [Candidatus Eremiobacteraeota bacterium]